MGRKAKYSKDVKVTACEGYEKNNNTFQEIDDETGCEREVVRRWRLTYKKHGSTALDSSNKNQTHSKEFKLSVVQEYTSCKC